MNAEAMESRLKTLEEQVKTLQTLLDIEEIKKLQRAYGYYLEHWMAKEIVDLFSDSPDVSLEFPWNEGTYLGKEGVRKYYENRKNPCNMYSVRYAGIGFFYQYGLGAGCGKSRFCTL